MLKRLFKYKGYILVIFVLIIAEPSITAWMYTWLQELYNSITVGTPRMVVIGTLLFGVLIWIAKRLLIYSISVIKSQFICNLKLDLKHDVFMSAMNMKTADLSHIAASGEYVSAFTNDITIIEQRYFSNVIGLIANIFSVVILVSRFFTMNKVLAAYVFSFNLLVMLIPVLFAKRLNKANLDYSNSLSKFTQTLKEFLGAFPTIKNYSVEKIICDKFDSINEDVERAKFNYDCSLSLADSIGSLLIWFTRIMVIGVGLVMLSQGKILLGTIVAAQAFAEEIAAPLQEMIENANSIRSVKSIVQKIKAITTSQNETKEETASPAGGSAQDILIEFQNLTIDIGGKKIVDDFSFQFKPGGKYLVIGKNGAGKSSVFKALKKRFQTYSGKILINGKDIHQIDNSRLSSLVSYLNENVAIFTGSLKDNISFWGHLDAGNLSRAMSRAHIDMNAERPVGENGFNLSSGEQRRIEIARCMMSPARVLILTR